MLILSILLILTLFLQNHTSAISDLKFIVRKNGSSETPYCISERSEKHEGISWIFPLTQNEQLHFEESFYLPSRQSFYDCKFSHNEHCSKVWSMKNWEIDTNTPRRFNYISDERWQDFPTIYTSNRTEKFSKRIEVLPRLKMGFSVRAAQYVSLYICEGWNPLKYSCYFFNVTENEITLKKSRTMSAEDMKASHILDSYRTRKTIISEDEWRNFQVGVDETGRIYLKDILLNRTVIEKTEQFPLKPAYFFFESQTPSLWKIHQNDFFYTKTPQTSRLGPSLKLNSEDLCVNLYVTMCPKCTMAFFIIENGTKTPIDQTELREGEDWNLIQLSRDQIKTDHLNIFVQTLLNENGKSNGVEEAFWGIDDVRVCHKNEIRVSTIKNSSGEISCQIVDKPQLRPLKEVYENVEESILVESETNRNSINLTWNHNGSQNLDYFISYQANDLCSDPPFNIKRTQSNGFFTTKLNKISLRNLVPYTTYNISISTVFHEKPKELTLYTKETPYISLEEQPNRIKIEGITENTANISWEKVDCRNIYGHIIYSMKLIEKGTENASNLGSQTENSIVLRSLKPFTNYLLNITTSRDVKTTPINSVYSTSIPFATSPGVANAPKNLEIYATSPNSISLRYDFPDENQGEPIEIHVKRCNPLTLKKCKSFQMPVEQCKTFLVPKFCLDIPNLVPNQKQTIRVSLKNDGSHTFGKEAIVEGYTEERIPGQPNNITAQLVDCKIQSEQCNLNISWLHPYNQNGTITSFEIFLNSSDDNSESLQAIYQTNLEYHPRYNYQFKFVPYSKTYELFIRSLNGNLKSEYSSQVIVHTMDLGDQIDQSPNIIKLGEDSVEIELRYDPRLETTVTILVQDYDENVKINEEISSQIELMDNLDHEYGNTWISQTVKVDETTKIIRIGSSDQYGKPLKPSTKYFVVFLMENKYHNRTHESVYDQEFTTLPHIEKAAEDGISVYLIIIVVLLILIILAALTLWCIKKRRMNKRRRMRRRVADEDSDHAYETLPFDEAVIVNNNMYDRLQHK